MCGLAGFIDPLKQWDFANAIRMAASLTHRGPDQGGCWGDPAYGVALAHRRLAVLEVSPAGGQPMASADGQRVLVFNGEIYNHLEIRKNLEQESVAPAWKGHSDTETLLAAISAWGLVKALQRSRGMFALGLWDRKTRTLSLARDRMGQKPLYYGKVKCSFAFASELKAIRAIPNFSPVIDRGALALMLRYGYVPCPHSIYQGFFKLPPGTMLHIRVDGSYGEPEEWWSFRQIIQNAKENKLALNETDAVDQLEKLMGAAVNEQMVADVPLGALLSGGIDSSLVVALMQARGKQPVQTFTIGFKEKEFDESGPAKLVARHLGTHHTELLVNPKKAMEVIPRLPKIYDEPFGDASQVPTALVCEMTRRHVTVALSGDAGDELFGGYNRYFWTPELWLRMQQIPRFLRFGIGYAIPFIPANVYNRIERAVRPFLKDSLQVNNPGDKLHKIAEVLTAPTGESLFQGLISQWHGDLPLLTDSEPPSLVSEAERWPSAPNFSEKMMAVDTLTYLPDDILVKVDRAAMAVGLETRAPFLDERIIEFAWRLPANMKVRGKTGKWLLRQLLHRYVPATLFERPKQGFGVPIDTWLRGPLRFWAEDLLDANKIQQQGYLDHVPIQTKWKEHLRGVHNWQYPLWNILMFQAWYRNWHSSN